MLIKQASLPGHSRTNKENDLYLDIETTGFDRKRTILYMIGCAYYDSAESDQLQLIQWFNDDGKSEKEILSAFLSFLDNFFTYVQNPRLISFNGRQFDLPYLADHCWMHDLAFDPDACRHLDYYRLLNPFRRLLALQHGRQKDWEAYLGIVREDRFSGKDLIRVYRDYLKNPSDQTLALLLMHNRDDLIGLAGLKPLIALPSLWEGGFTVKEMKADATGDGLEIFCRLHQPLPRALSFEDIPPLISFTAEGDSCVFHFPLFEGSLCHFYPNPSEYYYLPQEDRAIHKSVARYVDRDYRVQADASNCYIKKDGLFLPLPAICTGGGFRSGNRFDRSRYPVYKKNHSERDAYALFEDVFGQETKEVSRYLADLLNEASKGIQC